MTVVLDDFIVQDFMWKDTASPPSSQACVHPRRVAICLSGYLYVVVYVTLCCLTTSCHGASSFRRLWKITYELFDCRMAPLHRFWPLFAGPICRLPERTWFAAGLVTTPVTAASPAPAWNPGVAEESC